MSDLMVAPEAMKMIREWDKEKNMNANAIGVNEYVVVTVNNSLSLHPEDKRTLKKGDVVQCLGIQGHVLLYQCLGQPYYFQYGHFPAVLSNCQGIHREHVTRLLGIDITPFSQEERINIINAQRTHYPQYYLEREQLFELGRKGPFHRYINFPIEPPGEKPITDGIKKEVKEAIKERSKRIFYATKNPCGEIFLDSAKKCGPPIDFDVSNIAIYENIEGLQATDKCICKIDILMTSGCRCGFLEKEKAKLS